MTKYREIKDLVPVKDDIIKAAQKTDLAAVETIFKQLLDSLLAENSNSDDAVMIYNAVLCLLDEIKDKAVFDNVLGRHSRVLRAVCSEARANISMSTAEIRILVNKYTAQQPDFPCIQIAGVRKTLRVTGNMGVVTPYLEGKDPEYAIMAGTTWAPINSQQLMSGGFVFSLPKTFDCAKTLSISKIDKNDLDGNGLTPAEFNLLCDLLIEQCTKIYGQETTKKLIIAAVTKTIEKIPSKVGEHGFQKIRDYAQTICNLSMNISAQHDSQHWLKWLLASNGLITITKDAVKLPQQSQIQYGIELLYPILPLFSKEWINAVNDPTIVSSNFRLGFVIHSMLYNAIYDHSNGVKMRLLAYPSCSFAIGADQDAAARIAALSDSKNLASTYMLNASNASTRDKLVFSLDDLINKKVFPETGVFIVSSAMQQIANTPTIMPSYKISKDIPNEATSLNGFQENDIIAIIPAQNSDSVSVWGMPIEKQDAESILPYLDFIPGQEQDDLCTVLLCKVVAKPTEIVKKALIASASKCVFVKTQEKWMF